MLSSCSSPEQGNEYLHSIDREISPFRGKNKGEIEKIYIRELRKYKQTGKKIFLLSSKYVNLVIHVNERLKQIPMVYELLRLNDNQYDYIIIACNYNLANQFEKSSPEWALKCIDTAIESDEKTGKRYYLPHLYHFKGRILYNNNDSKNALTYFNKALQTYDPQKETLYIASMYNNIGMCYDQMKKPDMAISETLKGIRLLEQKKQPSEAENVFINYMKGGLSQYFLEIKDYKKTEELLLAKLNFSLYHHNYRMAFYASKELITLYRDVTHETDKINSIIHSLNMVEPNLKDPEDRIAFYEMIQEYYSDKNDIQKFKSASQKLVAANKEYNKLAKKELKINFDIADNYIIKNANKENREQRKKNLLLTISIFLIFFIFLIIIINLIRTKKKKEELITKEKRIFEQDLELQREKIRNLHLNLNLKTETERAFLENLKKIKRSKNIEPEDIVKDLQFKVNNLILIDRKSNDLINESSQENKIFMKKLSKIFPTLSAQELKLCVYFKLNLAAKEISLIENFTVGSIRVYKAKVKAKLGLEKENNLSEFLNKF